MSNRKRDKTDILSVILVTSKLAMATFRLVVVGEHGLRMVGLHIVRVAIEPCLVVYEKFELVHFGSFCCRWLYYTTGI